MSGTVLSLNTHGQPGDTPMGRISYLMNKLNAQLSSPESNVSDEVKDLSEQITAIVNEFDPYFERMTSPHPPILNKMIDTGNGTDWKKIHEQGKTHFELIPEMTSGTWEAVVLQHLARTAKASTVLEVGMFTGTTTVSLAILPSVSKVVTLELEGFLHDFNRPYFVEAGVSDKIDVRIGDAHSTLGKLAEEGGSFDMVFIDADKPNYTSYLEVVLSLNLLAPGGFIAVDNTAYKAAPWAPDPSYTLAPGIHDFNQAVRDNSEIDVVMLPIRDGLSLIRRKGE